MDIKELRMRAEYGRHNKQCNHNQREMRTENDNEQDCILEMDFFRFCVIDVQTSALDLVFT